VNKIRKFNFWTGEIPAEKVSAGRVVCCLERILSDVKHVKGKLLTSRMMGGFCWILADLRFYMCVVCTEVIEPAPSVSPAES